MPFLVQVLNVLLVLVIIVLFLHKNVGYTWTDPNNFRSYKEFNEYNSLKNRVEAEEYFSRKSGLNWPRAESDSKTNSCIGLLNKGRWNLNSWMENGFNRDFENSTIKYDPSDSRVEFRPHRCFEEWGVQNYSGKWESVNDCEIHRIKPAEIQQCFENGKGRVLILGDSRSRQLARSMQLYSSFPFCMKII